MGSRKRETLLLIDKAVVANQIRLHRERAGLTQAALADMMGVARQTVSQWESKTGTVGLSCEVLNNLAQVLDVPVPSLLFEA